MSTLNGKALRRAFGSFMTGVTVVTTRTPQGRPVGFTANSFTSVSLDPPLLLVCPGKFLSSYGDFATCKHFAINVLSEGQEAISNTFARSKGDRFAGLDHSDDQNGTPLIKGALAQFSCRTVNVVPAGDHCILIGQVDAFSHAEGRGLGYADGAYFSLGLERAALHQTRPHVVCGAIITSGDTVLLEETARGFRPPQIKQSDWGRLRQTLMDHLRAQGVNATLSAAYSVFDDVDTHHAYFLARAERDNDPTPFASVPVSDLPGLRYATPAISDMMSRFAIESRTRSFSLYLGDAAQGDTHAIQERT